MKRIILSVILILVGMIGCSTTENSANSPPLGTEKEKPQSKQLASDIEELIQQLGADDWEMREKAQETLENWPADKIGEIESVITEASESKDPEIRNRANRILKFVVIKKRCKLSESLLKEFPDIYYDLIEFNTKEKFKLLQQITAKNKRGYKRKCFKYYDKVTNQDIANLIGEILSVSVEELSYDEITIIIFISSGVYTEGSLEGGWFNPIPEAAPHIRKLLKNEGTGILNRVFHALSDLKDKESIPEIRRFLNNEDPNVWEEAVKTLAKLGDKESIPNIIALLGSKDREVLYTGNIDYLFVFALETLGVKESTPYLIESLKDGDSIAKARALYVLGRIGSNDSMPEIMKSLQDNSPMVRSAAIDALNKLGAKSAIPEIRKMLNDPDGYVRCSAIGALRDFNVKEAIPEIIGLIKKKDSGVYLGAVYALGKLKAKEAVPEIIEFLKNEDDALRQYAADALGEIGAKEAIPELIKSLKDKDNVVRQSVITALGMLGTGEAIPEMLDLLKMEEDEDVIRAVIRNLSFWNAKDSISIMINLLKNKIPMVKYDAARALAQLNAKEAIPELLNMLDDKESTKTVLEGVIFALGELGVKEATPKMIELLDEPADVAPYHVIANALATLNAKEGIPEIIKMLDEDKYGKYVQACAILALGRMNAMESVPELIKILEDEENQEWIRGYAAISLSELKVKDKTTEIMKLLKLDDEKARGCAVLALIELGEKDKIATERLEDLRSLLNGEWSDYYKKRIRAALKELGINVEEAEGNDVPQGGKNK